MRNIMEDLIVLIYKTQALLILISDSIQPPQMSP